jgi:Mg-chelatase subunit ChlD
MRSVYLFLLVLVVGLAEAQEIDELRLIQAQSDLPSITLWLNLPNASVLKPKQFSISIGKQPATVTAIESSQQTGEGVAYIFLVDISKSLSPHQFEQIKTALHRWLDGMGEHDQAALLTFGREVKQNLAFTANHDRLNKAIDNLAATDMETSLYRGLLEAINLGRRQADNLPARRAIVILSDGIDDSLSGVTEDEVFKQSQEYRVPIYSIGFATSPVNDTKRQGLKVLGMLARQSGGYFVQAQAAELDSAYAQQQQQIMQAYRLQLNCSGCQSDGQLYRLNLSWNDGQQTLSDGFDIRLLPKSGANKPKMVKQDAQGIPMQFIIFPIGFLAFIVGLVLVYRQRLMQSKDDSLLVVTNVVTDKPVMELQAAVSVKLTVVAGVHKGQVFQLKIAERVTLGRAENCDLMLDDDVEISSQHVLLQRLAGKLIARDLNSTNGTLVNGVPIHNDYPLRDGDLLLLGRTEMRIEILGQR